MIGGFAAGTGQPDESGQLGHNRPPALDYDVSLAAKYKRAMQLVARLESGELFATSDEFRQLHLECLETLTDCVERVEQLGMFSPNDSWDDISTPDIRYLNLSFYLGKVLEKTPINVSQMSVQSRMDVLNFAVHKYLEFLYDIMGLKLTLHTEAGPRTALVPFVDVEVLLPQGKYGVFDLSKFNARKDGRRVKQDNASRLRVAERGLMASKATAVANDEEMVRQVEADRLVMHWFATWEALLGISAEQDMLTASSSAFDVSATMRKAARQYVPASQLVALVGKSANAGGETFADLRMRMDRKADEDLSRKVENPIADGAGRNRLVGRDGKVRQPFVIMPTGDVNRARMAQSVFGTGQRMPTVTVEELVERELANQAKPQVSRKELDEALDDDNDAADDVLTMKARKWDDFTENNPRGSGNTLNLG